MRFQLADEIYSFNLNFKIVQPIYNRYAPFIILILLRQEKNRQNLSKSNLYETFFRTLFTYTFQK